MSFKELQESNKEGERKYKNCVLLAGRGQVSNVPKLICGITFLENSQQIILKSC